MPRLSSKDADLIRRRLIAKEPATSIAVDFGVSAVTVRKIGRGLVHRTTDLPAIEFSKAQRGDRNGRSKLSFEDVVDIRRRVGTRAATQISLAKKYGVSPSTISKICDGDRWASTTVESTPDFLKIRLADGRPARGSLAENELADTIFAYYRARGFPTRTFPQTRVKTAFDHLVASPSIIKDNYRLTPSNTALRLANAFHPHIDHVRCRQGLTPAEVFGDDVLLRKAIIKHIRYGRRLTPQGIRYAVYSYSGAQGASNFRPTVAKSLVALLRGQRVLDPCMGFGGRLLGTLAAGAAYVGIDPAAKTIDGNYRLVGALQNAGVTTQSTTIVQGCAEDLLGRQRFGRFDVALTSPPYFDIEKYDTAPTQSSIRYPDSGMWLNSFLRRLISGISSDLRVYGFMLMNVNRPLLTHVRDAGVSHGLREVAIFDYELLVRQSKQAKQGRCRSEPLILMQKMKE